VHESRSSPRQGEISHRFVHLDHEDKLDALVTTSCHDGRSGPHPSSFVRTKHGADRLVKRLVRHDVAAVAMHGNKTQSQRQRALAQFSSGKGRHCCRRRDVAARGIDVGRLSTHVINFDAPGDLRDAYVQPRVGRTRPRRPRWRRR
jgi:superfamily II DNA/RNA helicase